MGWFPTFHLLHTLWCHLVKLSTIKFHHSFPSTWTRVYIDTYSLLSRLSLTIGAASLWSRCYAGSGSCLYTVSACGVAVTPWWPQRPATINWSENKEFWLYYNPQHSMSAWYPKSLWGKTDSVTSRQRFFLQLFQSISEFINSSKLILELRHIKI